MLQSQPDIETAKSCLVAFKLKRKFCFPGQVHDERACVVHVLQAALRQDGRPPADAHEPGGPRRPPRRGLQRLQDAGRFVTYHQFEGSSF